jgi:3-methyladenine DNA glycosylase/8-oxoguanine DNA glycosylase
LDERDPELFDQQLVTISGIGPRIAEYMCMRALHWPDAFPAGDLGLQKAIMPGQRQTERQLHALPIDNRGGAMQRCYFGSH